MSEKAVSETKLSKHPLTYRGKVRDLYDLGDRILMVATDRISAFDFILPSAVPAKGKILTQLSVFWFNETKSILPNHLISTDVSPYVANAEEKQMLEGRTMVVKKAKRLNVEAIVRGYITGSAFKDYTKTGIVNGMKLPAGLKDGDKLAEPIFTPTTKAEVGDHDAPMTYEEVENLIGKDWARKVREVSLTLFNAASKKAASKGLILVDTKMEFGVIDDQLVLIDELLTQDSSRFWLASEYQPGKPLNPWDKQLVRDYLLKSTWDRKSTPPPLPEEVVKETLHRYQKIAEKLMTTS
jgi:phosphoribosylaminoimidazole-succinocarboxamide synthase